MRTLACPTLVVLALGFSGCEKQESTERSSEPIASVDKAAAIKNKVVSASDSTIVDTIMIDLGDKTTYIIKDQLAMLDIIVSNIWDRPIYWAVTCREDRLLGLQDYLQLEGLALRLVPKKTPSSMNQYGIVGAGRVDTDQSFQNIMEKWRWGNFDKERLYVDRAYQPSLGYEAARPQTLAEHEQIAQAIEAGDAARAGELMHRHLGRILAGSEELVQDADAETVD